MFLCSYYRFIIPNYALLEAPLSAIAHGRGLQAQNKVTYTAEIGETFDDLKRILWKTVMTLTPSLPDPNRPYTQTKDEIGRNGWSECYSRTTDIDRDQ